MVADARNDGCGPGAQPIGLSLAEAAAGNIALPDFLAGVFVDGQEELSLSGPTPEDDKIAIKDRRRCSAPEVIEFAQVVAPQLLAVEIIADHAGRAVTGDDLLTVGHRGRGA